MSMNRYWVAYCTIVTKEVTRFMRIWSQTLLPPVITMSLYFVIFGGLIGPRIGSLHGYSYMQYIAPGIIMMAVITNSYSNVATSFFSAKFQKFVEEMLVAPIPPAVILAGYVTGGALRGVIVGALITVVAGLFTHLQVQAWWAMIAMAMLTAIMFSLAGFVNAIFAKKFDDISIVPTFVLTPLTYLGGVFYSIDLLPQPWRTISLANPILHMVEAFRYGLLGISDIDVGLAFALVVTFTVALGALSLFLLTRGYSLKP